MARKKEPSPAETLASKPRSQLTKADKTTIKQQQAAFIEKIRSSRPNEHQQMIFEAAQSGAGRYVVLAGPGSGKTFTSIKASTHFIGKAIYFSYNKKIQMDTNLKLVAIDSPMIATTAHAFGLSCLQAFTRGLAVVDDKEEKYSTIVKEYFAKLWPAFLQSIKAELEDDANVEVMRLDASSWSRTLIHYAQVSLTEPTPTGLATLVEDFDLTDINRAAPIWPFVVGTVDHALSEGKRQFLGPLHLVAFDDMIWLPNAIEGVPVRQYDHVIVDEAQDTSRASLELLLRACHSSSQVFFIGDPRQSIYAFAGADFDSINRIITRLNAATLPLRICYRCGSQIVDLANQLGGQLISAGLHTGNVEVVPDYLHQVRAGDAVLGRTTANLVKGCLQVLQTGRKAKVLGKNIGENIAAVVTRLEAMRVQRSAPALRPNLSNLLELLSEYQEIEIKSLTETRKNPEMAISELSDKVETVRAFFEAYVSKCHDASLRVADDPHCAWSKTAKDFKEYIHGLFSEDEGATDFVLFMTAHRSKGGEWENVYIIGTDEFPHPRAKSDRQKQQEENLMYVAVTRAIENLYFVGKPFACLSVPGYEPEEEQQQGLTIISYAAASHLEIHPAALEDHEQLEVIEAETTIEAPVVIKPDEIPAEPLIEGRVSRIAAIEVLCPACNGICVDPASGSTYITQDLVGHTIICSRCKQACIVPLNAFTLSGDVIAREKPVQSVPNAKVEKKGRTRKERKSNAGRKAKGSEPRQPLQLSLDMRVIRTLKSMGINTSALFEELLNQYEPFLEAYAAVNDELDDDESDE